MSRFDQMQYDYDEEPAMLQLVAFLVRARGQFTVCQHPQDLKFAERTGWVISWPKGQTVVLQAEPPSTTEPDSAA
jgi:hypothetical protein